MASLKRPPVLHPFLFAPFPILALYAHNIRDIPVPLKEIGVPLALALGTAAVLYLVFAALFRSPGKAGLAASLIVLWVLSFGHLTSWLSVWTGGIFDRSLFFATAVLVLLAVILIGRRPSEPGALTRVLNVIAATLVIINAASIVQTAARRPRIPAGEDVRTSRPAAARPDIYYLVLDAYARADVLSEVFGFDNTPFVRGLEARGFTVAGRSYANYNLTQQSLASTLNMTYLDGLAKDVGYASSDREPLYAMIRGNRVMAFLKSQGYRVVTVSSSIEPTDFRGVDRYFGFALSESEFRSVLLDTTPWPLFFGSRRSAESYDAHRGRILNAFRSLEEAPYEKGPFFMFVHIMAPHPPFVLGPNGEAREPNYLFSMVDADRLHGNEPRAVDDYIVRYREQLAFLNTRILAAVDAILARSADPPVIVIQGDHGSRAYADLDRPEASYLEENLAILNAFHLPGPAGGSAYPEITPVNTFRLIFRGYFNADLELLPDASAWTTWRRPYRFLPFDVKAYTGSIGSAKAERRPEAPAVQRR
jgi:hypothetical protein